MMFLLQKMGLIVSRPFFTMVKTRKRSECIGNYIIKKKNNNNNNSKGNKAIMKDLETSVSAVCYVKRFHSLKSLKAMTEVCEGLCGLWGEKSPLMFAKTFIDKSQSLFFGQTKPK